MKNILNTKTDGTPALLSNVDEAGNSLFINGTEISSSSWVGEGTYTFTVGSHTYTISKAPDNDGNYQLLKVSDYTYHFVKIVSKSIDDLAEQVASLTTTVGGLSGDVSSLQTTVGGLSGDVSSLQTDVGTINTKVTNFMTLHDYTGNTNSSGILIPSPAISSSSYIIVAAYANKSGLVIPYVNSSDGNWRFKVMNTALNPSASIEITIYYLRIPA